jgi:hypothetical protein
LIEYILKRNPTPIISKSSSMKNIFLALLAPISMAMTMSGAAFAQDLDNSALLSFSNHKKISSRYELNRTADSGVHYLNDINLKAVRGFIQEFKDVDNVKWIKSEKGYLASFVKDSVETRVLYDKRGNFEVQFRYYLENRLSPEIRSLVKSIYYDYHIFQISEARKDGVTCYRIKIRDDNHCKVINVINGEIEVIVEYTDAAPR